MSNHHIFRFRTLADWTTWAREARFRPRKLARLCQVSPRHLERWFRKRFRRTPRDCLDELRLQEAANQLLQDKQVKEIASDLGFANPSHFIRKFKRSYGCTPLRYAALAHGITQPNG